MRAWVVPFLLLLAAPGVHGATRFVTTGGADSGDCTSAPCATLTYAIGQAAAGDGIDVGAGSFDNGGAPVVVDKQLVLRGHRSGVDARGRGGPETVLGAPVQLRSDGAVVDGFTITCAACRACPTCPVGAAIESAFPFAAFDVTNNVIRGNWLGMRFGAAAGEQSTVRFNDFIDNDGQQHSIAVFLIGGTGAAVVIDQNRFRGSVGPHVEVSTWSSPDGGLKITANEFDLDTVDDGQAVWLSAARGVEISGNRITGGAQPAIQLLDRSRAAILRNVITGNTREAIRLGGDVPFALQPNEVVRIEENTILENERAIHVGPQPQPPPEVHFNRIARDGVALYTSGANEIDAENNWWGCNGEVCATRSLAPGSSADVSPWLVMSIDATKFEVAWNETSTITAHFNRNSDHQAVAGFPPADIEFEAAGGVVSPEIVQTSGGAASTVFRPTVIGAGSVTARLDGHDATVNLTLPLTQPRRRAMRHGDARKP